MPPYLVPDRVKHAQNRARHSGIAIGHFNEPATVQIPCPASHVDFQADTMIGVLSIAQSTFNEQDLGS